MSGDRFEIESSEDYGAYDQPSRSPGCFKGCLIGLGVLLVLLLLGGIVVSLKWRGWVSSMALSVMRQALEASSLPQAEKLEVAAELTRVVDAFRQKQLSAEQFQQIITALVESPLMDLFVVSVVEEQYLKKSDLPPEEIEAGRNTLRRFVNGVIHKKIKQEGVDNVLEHVADRQPNGEWVFRHDVASEDLRAMLADAKAEADKAEIPQHVEPIDPSDEVKRIVDDVLGARLPMD